MNLRGETLIYDDTSVKNMLGGHDQGLCKGTV